MFPDCRGQKGIFSDRRYQSLTNDCQRDGRYRLKVNGNWRDRKTIKAFGGKWPGRGFDQMLWPNQPKNDIFRSSRDRLLMFRQIRSKLSMFRSCLTEEKHFHQVRPGKKVFDRPRPRSFLTHKCFYLATTDFSIHATTNFSTAVTKFLIMLRLMFRPPRLFFDRHGLFYYEAS